MKKPVSYLSDPERKIDVIKRITKVELSVMHRWSGECPKIYRKSVLNLLRRIWNMRVDAVQVCSNIWNAQYVQYLEKRYLGNPEKKI